MSLYHEFLLLPDELTAQFKSLQSAFCPEDRYSYRSPPNYTTSQKEVLCQAGKVISNIRKNNLNNMTLVHDNIILPNLCCFEHIDSYLDGIVPFCGLAYYAVTLIPQESVSSFSAAINLIPSLKNSALRVLCEEAATQRQTILHWGI